MRFFTPQLNQEQMVTGLGAAAAGVLLIVPVVVSDVVMRDQPMDWTYLVIGFAVASVSGVYITHKVRTARDGALVIGPTVSFLTTCCSSAALMFGHLGTHEWSANMYIAALVLPCIFFAITGDTWMIVLGLSFTAAEVAVCLSVDGLGVRAFAVLLMFFVSIDGIATAMVSPSIRRLQHRFRSREAVAAVTGTLATAETIDEGLAACLPQIHTVIPCRRVLVVARALGPGGYVPRVVQEWHADAVDSPAVDTVELPTELERSTDTVVVDGRCFIPVGFSALGELTLVLDGIDSRKLVPVFVQVAAAGLATSVLRMNSRIAYVADLRHESRTDPLTGLANRRVLEERTEVEVARSARTGQPVTVAMVDLDHFKAYNDRFGHQRGDEALQAISTAMHQRLRAEDLLARYGGEEFCLVLPGTDLDAAEVILDDLRRVAGSVDGGYEMPTISAGVAQWDGAEDVYHLIGRADRALYEAKRLGRDRVVVAALRAS